MSEAPVIFARALRQRYGTLVAVDGVELAARRGTCLGLLGPNGAGKTTTIEILEGLRRPDEGEVRILDLEWNRDGRRIRERIGVQLQETRLQEKLTVRETVRLFRSFYAEGRPIEEVLDLVGLEEKATARVGNLSGGQKQRLALGCALVNRPDVLFLDEPTTGLDPQARRRVWEIVASFKEGGGTVLLTTHYMEEAERLADDLVIMDHGRVIARGSPPAIIASLGAESVVEFRPLADDAGHTRAVPEAELLALPGVKQVRAEPGGTTLTVADVQACLPALLHLLKTRDLPIEDLRTHRPTLEDVFVTLTGKHLRDA